MSDRKAIILETLRANPYANQLAISREIKARTGQGVAFPQLKKLRKAVAAGNFSSTYDAIFASKEVVAVKRGPGRPRKNPLPVAGEIKRGPGRPRKDGSPAMPRKERGDRRAKYDPRGRRRSDLNKVQLDDFSEHLVVYRTKDGLRQETFKSRSRAEGLVRNLLNSGYAATDIAYYKLNPFKTKVTVQL